MPSTSTKVVPRSFIGPNYGSAMLFMPDESASAVMWLEEDGTYRFSLWKSGEILAELEGNMKGVKTYAESA